jgi:methyl-accepting chemotaxis protein
MEIGLRKQTRVGTRLASGFGLVVLLLAAVAVLSVTRLREGAQATEEIVSNRHAKVVLAFEIKSDVNAIARNLRNAVLARAPEDRKPFIDKVNAAAASSAERLGKLDKVLNLPGSRDIFRRIMAARDANIEVRGRIEKLLEAGKHEQAVDLLFVDGIPKQNAYFAELDKLVGFQQELMTTIGKRSTERAGTATAFASTMSVCAALLAVGVGIVITRGLLKELGGEPAYAADIVKTIAARDLSVSVETRPRDQHSMLAAVRGMREDLAGAVGAIRTGTETIAAASQQIAAGSADLAARTEEQASSLEETASSMEELTSAVKQNADNARQANQLALAASDMAIKGGAAVAEVVHTMGAINTSAKRIADIIGVIDGIAFQTNILALNAAVEAARAGEEGRGFAVVASEVRNLAQRSATAAKEIKALIDNSVGEIEAGSRLVEQAGTTTRDVVEAIGRVTGLMGEISAASLEQTAGIEQVNNAIAQMDQVTQQNAALVEEAAAAAESLQEQAEKLARVVGEFRLPGQSHAMPAPRHAPVAVPGIANGRYSSIASISNG